LAGNWEFDSGHDDTSQATCDVENNVELENGQSPYSSQEWEVRYKEVEVVTMKRKTTLGRNIFLDGGFPTDRDDDPWPTMTCLGSVNDVPDDMTVSDEYFAMAIAELDMDMASDYKEIHDLDNEEPPHVNEGENDSLETKLTFIIGDEVVPDEPISEHTIRRKSRATKLDDYFAIIT